MATKEFGRFDLTLSVNRSGGWNEANHRAEVQMHDKNLPPVIFHRDNYTCQSCGLKLERGNHHLEIHHIDGNHENNRKGNLATFCPYCHMCYHLDFVGKSNSGTVIFFPEITQVEFFHMFRALKISKKYKDTGMIPELAITELEAFLTDRCKFTKSMFSSDSATDFSSTMRQIIQKNKNDTKLHDGLKYFRILPNEIYYADNGRNIFADMVTQWEKYYMFDTKSIDKVISGFNSSKIPNMKNLFDSKEYTDKKEASK